MFLATLFDEVSAFFAIDLAEVSICSGKAFIEPSAFFAIDLAESSICSGRAFTAASELFNILSALPAPNKATPPSPIAEASISAEEFFPSFKSFLKPLASPAAEAKAPIAA